MISSQSQAVLSVPCKQQWHLPLEQLSFDLLSTALLFFAVGLRSLHPAENLTPPRSILN